MGWYEVLRYVVLGAAGWLALLAGGSALVRSRRISPFSPLARTIRRLSDPWIVPVERRLVRAGQNPQQAPWWLAGGGVVGGLIVLFLSRWLYGLYRALASAARGGMGSVLRFGLDRAFDVLIIALVIRVIASWFGVSPYRRWMRPVVALTEWMLAPLRRVIPPFGMIDVTPLVAWFLLIILRSLLFSIL